MPLRTRPHRRRSLAGDVLLTFQTKVAILVLNVLGAILIARILGPTGRGAIAVAFSFTVLLVQFGSFGLQSANPYFVARNSDCAGAVVRNAVWSAVAIGGVLAMATFLAKAWFPASLRGLDWLDVVVVAAGLPAVLAMQLLQSVFLAEGRMRAYNGVELAGSVVTFGGLLVGLVVLHVGVLGAIMVMVSANWGMALTFLVLQRGHASGSGQFDLGLFWAMLKYGFRVYVTTCLAYLVGRVNLIAVDAYLGPAQAGFYAIGLGASEAMHLFPSIVALNLFPRIARGAPFEHSAAVFRVLFVLFGVLCLITVPLVGPAVNLLYGSRFAAAIDIYYWMLPGIFCYGMLNVLSYHFAGRGFPLEAMLIWFPGLLVNVTLVVLLLPGHHPYVAAFAATVAYAIVLALHMRLFAKESGGYRALVPRSREIVMFAGVVAHNLRPRFAGR